MLLPLYHLPFPFPTKTLDSSQILFFTSQSISSPYPKPLKSVIRSSSTTNTETLSKTAIERIAEKLRSLGYVEDEEKSKQSSQQKISNGSAGEIFLPSSQSLPKQRVGYTIDSSWSTPETVPKPGSGTAVTRFRELKSEVKNQKRLEKKREVKVPTLAELTIPQEELRRLRKIGIALRKKLKVGVAGITEGIVNGIHERWRRSEVVKISCEDLCKLNMKRTHDLLERKTGGLVVWRSGSTIIIYRGTNYKFPYFLTDTTTNDTSHDELSSESSMDDGVVGEKESNLVSTDGVKSGLPSPPNTKAGLGLVHGVGSPNKVRFLLPGEAQLAEEADRLLDGLGPRFTDWWGYEPLPIDADLLPAIVPGYRRPFRLLPYGVKPKLTDDEMTTLRRLGHPLPCHFALGRNRNLQGLAASMVKLWEKCEIAKIAVKRGVQNTNSEMMAEELKRLTGGTLLSRDKEFIAFYRGKDFLPPAVSTAIEERRKPRIHREKPSTIQSPSIESRPELESSTKEPTSVGELQEMNDRKDRKPRSTNSVMKSISTKLSMVLQKKEKAEQLLTKLEKEAETQKPEVDRQGITEEERYMLKKVGLRMKPFLLLGRRGVFDGTIENMHLHWKYRELVKIITSARCIEDVHGVAKTLEAESGGILVAVERVNRDYAIIMYRGKNYQRPADLRPRTLLNKRQAMKRSLEAQRCESLKLHVLKLTKNIDELKLQLAKEDTEKNHVPSTEHQRETTQFETRDHLSSVKCSQNEKNAGSVESARSPEATEGHRYDSTSLSSDYLIDDIEEATHLDKLMNYFPKYDEFAKTEVESTHKAVVRETHSDNFQDEVGDIVYDVSFPENVLSQGGGACAVLDKAEVHDSDKESVEPSIEFGDNELNSLVHRDEMEKGLDGVPFRAKPLSNRERLILRKQALKMKKRPVLAVGRSNVVTGVAKAIKTHFQKNPLAIVNVKGRAKGTSIQELVTKLEQATGAVMVSQEPNKVILYRGWGEGEGDEARGATKDKTNARTVAGRVGGKRNVVSPQLMAAIRLECGLMVSKEERT